MSLRLIPEARSQDSVELELVENERSSKGLSWF